MAVTLNRAFAAVVFVLAIVGVVAIAAGAWLIGGGIGTKAEPTRAETAIARRVRSIAIPRSARDTAAPSPSSPESVKAGMEHFADHCAICHANDGSGDVEMGRGMYPRVPDMRKPDTQSLSDGELFYIIENGVRLTGMPAWGNGSQQSAESTWQLVHFIRHLPSITDADVEAMKALNPKSPEEWREEEEARRFLEGGSEPEKQPAPPAHKHGD
jgi:mono/diheme cytochrome c family protein